MKKKLFLLLTLALPLALPAAPARAQVISPTAPRPVAQWTDDEIKALGQGVVFPYDYLERVLAKNVDKAGHVAYGKVKGENDLEIFVRAVGMADLSKFPNWTIPADPDDPKSVPHKDMRPELNFWINAYNGLFLKALADAFPVHSPAEIRGLDTDKTRKVAGKNYSFAELRRNIAAMDRRALFALPDGTRQGPRWQQTAFRFSGLDAVLDMTAYSYINDRTFVGPFEAGTGGGSVAVSPWLQTIDEYYKEKTGRRKWDGIRNALGLYTKDGSARRFFLNDGYAVEFMTANTALNEPDNME